MIPAGPDPQAAEDAPDIAARLLAALTVSVALHALALFGLGQGLLRGESIRDGDSGSRVLMRAALLPPPAPAAQFLYDPAPPILEQDGTQPPPQEPAAMVAPTELQPAGAAPAPGGDLQATAPVLPSQRYLRTPELDVRPGIRTRVEPVYPEQARQAGLRGRVVIDLYINEDGGVDRVQVRLADPPGLFEASTAEAFAAARFDPAHKDGQRVKSLITLEVEYAPTETPRSPR